MQTGSSIKILKFTFNFPCSLSPSLPPLPVISYLSSNHKVRVEVTQHWVLSLIPAHHKPPSRSQDWRSPRQTDQCKASSWLYSCIKHLQKSFLVYLLRCFLMYYPSFLMNDRRRNKILPPQQKGVWQQLKLVLGEMPAGVGICVKEWQSEVSRPERGMSGRLQNHGQMQIIPWPVSQNFPSLRD